MTARISVLCRLGIIALLAGGAAQAAISDAPGIPQVRIEVTRRADAWTAEFIFDRSVTAWVFRRSDLTSETRRPWRQENWNVSTRGVRLQRRGNYDVLTAERGELPRRVIVNFKPVSEGLEQDHPPALIFTDGSVALFVAQFDCFPMDSLAAVRALPGDLNNHPVPAARLKYAFRDAAGPVLLGGKRSPTGETTEKDTYVLFGATSPVETPDMIGVFDPQLPDWIQQSLTRGVPALIGRYTQELGALRRFKPTVLVSWEGPTRGIMSREGGALNGLIAMRYAGAGLLEETGDQRHVGLWFIAHEAAHFWLGQTVAYEYARDAWITEGGAELLAFRAVAEVDPEYDPRIPLNRAIEECIGFTENRGVARAGERGERRAFYACGAVFALVAEAGSGRSYYKFARRLVDANRADGVVSRAEWLAALDAATRKPDLSRDVARLLDRGVPNSREFITDLLVRAGVNLEVDPAGIPRLR
jgi:hypothetical protein